MKTLFFASALALIALWFAAPAGASVTPLPQPSSSFTSGSLHVDVYGAPGKQALVFVPGLTCGPWEWSGEIARFANTYTIYALTLPGFDGTAPVQGPLFKTVSADFWAMLASHNIVMPIVVGHSLGGTLAIMLAEQHSDRIRGVIAVDGLPVFPGTENQSAAQRAAAAAAFRRDAFVRIDAATVRICRTNILASLHDENERRYSGRCASFGKKRSESLGSVGYGRLDAGPASAVERCARSFAGDRSIRSVVGRHELPERCEKAGLLCHAPIGRPNGQGPDYSGFTAFHNVRSARRIGCSHHRVFTGQIVLADQEPGAGLKTTGAAGSSRGRARHGESSFLGCRGRSASPLAASHRKSP